jgi:hypothetical protein
MVAKKRYRRPGIEASGRGKEIVGMEALQISKMIMLRTGGDVEREEKEMNGGNMMDLTNRR